MGGPDVGACGFAIGMERVLIALGSKKDLSCRPIVVYVATLGRDGKTEGFRLAEKIKEELNKERFKIVTLVDFEEPSLKSQMRAADKVGAKFVLIIGDEELKKNEAILRDMNTKEQVSVKFDKIVNAVKERIG